MQPGVYTLNWDGSSQSSGVYFLQLTSGDLKKTRKIMLLK
ncbi:MAG: T9SS type A sorting domain-containing protein [FCB group bacterium]|nr:T9SS type A sorting domain-containing protein [FCB group bacterium]